MPLTGLTDEQSSRLRGVVSVMLGMAWMVAATSVAEPVSHWLDSRYNDGFAPGIDGEFLMIAAAMLPLAFIHSPQRGLAQVWVAHAGVFTLLATFSLLLSPWGPYPLLPWLEPDADQTPVYFYGPFAVWAVASLFVLGIQRLHYGLARTRLDGTAIEFGTWAALVILIGGHWWFTLRFIVPGFPLSSRIESFRDTLIRLAIGAVYVTVGCVCAGVFRRPTPTSNT